MIGIRADANEQIATGHIMRCMTIADEIKKLGEEVIFYTADDVVVELINSRGFNVEVLGSDWKNPVSEIDKLVDSVKKLGIKTLLFDSYSFRPEYFETFRAKAGADVKIAAMDDLAEEVFPVDYLINYNAYGITIDYEKMYGNDTRFLLGLMYAPLRPQFADVPDRKSQNFPLKVLVASGGGDTYGIVPAIIREISKRKALDDYDFHVILGQFAQSQNEIERIIWCSHNIFRHDKVTAMAELMSSCDIAISASGVMLSELCATKTPTIYYVLADNQLPNAKYYGENGLMINGGDIRDNVDRAAARILDELEELASDKLMQREYREKLKGLCDGRGAERLAKVLCGLE